MTIMTKIRKALMLVVEIPMESINIAMIESIKQVLPSSRHRGLNRRRQVYRPVRHDTARP